MFDSVQMAVSRVIKLQHHRIAQVGVSGQSSAYLMGKDHRGKLLQTPTLIGFFKKHIGGVNVMTGFLPRLTVSL